MVKHSTYPAPPWFPLELNCSNEEQNSVPFIWISDNGGFSQLVTNFFPTACLHEIKGGIFSACSRLTEWNELYSHSHCSRHFFHIPHYGDKISMADGVFNIVIFFFIWLEQWEAMQLKQPVPGSVSASTACPSAAGFWVKTRLQN